MGLGGEVGAIRLQHEPLDALLSKRLAYGVGAPNKNKNGALLDREDCHRKGQ